MWSYATALNDISFKKRSLDQIILKINDFCYRPDSCGWQFAICSEENGSALQKNEFNLDTVGNFLTSQDIKLGDE